MDQRNLGQTPLTFLAVLLLICWISGCRTSDGSQDDGPPYAPDEARATLEVADGFTVELVAAEPHVSDPVAMEVDEYGRLYVVEMHGYPLDTGGSGKIKLLEDTDGDGAIDAHTVFAEGLILPTGIMRWKEGVLVTDAPDVLYLADTDGDGRADVKEVVLTGFARSNPQHNVNTPLYGLDNWIYLAHEPAVTTVQFQEQFGGRGEEITYPGQAGAPRLAVNAEGRNIRFRPDTYALEALSARSQFGHTFDAWGHHFLVSNAQHQFHEVIAARYLERNPSLPVRRTTHETPEHGGTAEVFPITRNPEHQLLTSIGVFTSASGITAYLGGAFPDAYDGVMFVAEPVHNLVHVDRVRDAGATFVAERMQEGTEFLASTDSWFRPVSFYVGPDGALYVMDYYRQIIEHPEWMSEEVNQSGALYNGVDRGRIYRITPEGTSPPSWLNNLDVGDASDEELVEMLEEENLWWRRTAQRLLVDRNREAAVVPLTRLVRESPSATARVHALWTLQGLGRLDAALIEHALGDAAPGVRENAIRLAELHLEEAPGLASPLFALAEDPSPKVRFQLLNTLGYVETERAADIREEMLFADIEDAWVQIAALTASSKQEIQLLERAVARLADEETEPRAAFFARTASIIGARQNPAEINRTMRLIAGTTEPSADWWRAASLQGLAEGLRTVEGGAASLASERGLLLQMFLASDTAPLRQAALTVLEVIGLPAGSARRAALQQAAEIAADRDADAERRAGAIQLLAMADPAAYRTMLQERVSPQEPAPVQAAAVRALGRISGDEVVTFLLSEWETMTPAVRDEAVDVALQEPERIALLLDAVEQRVVQPSTIGWGRSVRLMTNRDDALRERARALLSEEPTQRQEVVDQYHDALTMRGDAERGSEVFARVCAACHQVGGQAGTAFGPDLGTVRNRRAEALLVDILVPNRSIADGYEQWTVERKSGDTVYGVIPDETPTSVTLRDATGNETIVARPDIESMAASNVSMMPVGLEAQISVSEMADLLAFLRSSR